MIPISVITSVYNDEKFIGKTIESLLNQTFKAFEFIIINDGSTDNSPNIIQKYAAQDKRIKIFHQKNAGLTKALNYGLKKASGKYIARLDASDLSYPDRLMKQYSFMECNPEVAVCWSWFDVIDENDNYMGKFEFPVGRNKLKKKLTVNNIFAHSTAFFRKEKILLLGGYREEFLKSQDRDLWLRVIEKYDVGAIKGVLCSYRYEKNSISISQTSDQSLYGALALQCYKYRIKHGDDKQILREFKESALSYSTPKYSRKNLYLANLYLRSGKNSKARLLFLKEIKNGFNIKLGVKIFLSVLPFNWSFLYRRACLPL